MTDRLQVYLLVSLTLLGLTSITSIVVMEMSGHQTVGVLSAVAGAVVVALTGLMSRWGESLKPLTNQMAQIQKGLDDNTRVTKDSAAAAVENAQVAAKTATEAKNAANVVANKLNGGIEHLISSAVEPVQNKLDQHITYVHERQHDVRNLLQTLTTQLAVVIKSKKEDQN